LLRNLTVTRPNQVWAMDITYIPMARGFIYLAAVVDWFTRRVLAWRVSITLDAQIQLASPTWRNKISDTHQPPRTEREQPIEAPQLEPRLAAISASTIAADRIRRLTGRHPIRPTSTC
jgi:hypothetical protein